MDYTWQVFISFHRGKFQIGLSRTAFCLVPYTKGLTTIHQRYTFCKHVCIRTVLYPTTYCRSDFPKYLSVTLFRFNFHMIYIHASSYNDTLEHVPMLGCIQDFFPTWPFLHNHTRTIAPQNNARSFYCLTALCLFRYRWLPLTTVVTNCCRPACIYALLSMDISPGGYRCNISGAHVDIVSY